MTRGKALSIVQSDDGESPDEATLKVPTKCTKKLTDKQKEIDQWKVDKQVSETQRLKEKVRRMEKELAAVKGTGATNSCDTMHQDSEYESEERSDEETSPVSSLQAQLQKRTSTPLRPKVAAARIARREGNASPTSVTTRPPNPITTAAPATITPIATAASAIIMAAAPAPVTAAAPATATATPEPIAPATAAPAPLATAAPAPIATTASAPDVHLTLAPWWNDTPPAQGSRPSANDYKDNVRDLLFEAIKISAHKLNARGDVSDEIRPLVAVAYKMRSGMKKSTEHYNAARSATLIEDGTFHHKKFDITTGTRSNDMAENKFIMQATQIRHHLHEWDTGQCIKTSFDKTENKKYYLGFMKDLKGYGASQGEVYPSRQPASTQASVATMEAAASHLEEQTGLTESEDSEEEPEELPALSDAGT
ncbi:hypothetical protein C8Q74DRAFT_1219765 [Fomes fomentarius]|nr:hypothetical protein C8Q74DRAFT_1219765 [Fomes fomentarius]